MYKNTVVLSVSLFKNTTLKAAYSETIDTKSAAKLIKKIVNKQIKALVVFSKGLYGEDYEEFIKGLRDVNQKMLIAGGLASDDFHMEKTFIIFGTEIFQKDSVAVSFSGEIHFEAPLKEGQKVRFGFSNTATVISGADTIAADLADKPTQTMYIFSCIAHKMLLRA